MDDRAGPAGSCASWLELQQVNIGPAGYSCIASLPKGEAFCLM